MRERFKLNFEIEHSAFPHHRYKLQVFTRQFLKVNFKWFIFLCERFTCSFTCIQFHMYFLCPFKEMKTKLQSQVWPLTQQMCYCISLLREARHIAIIVVYISCFISGSKKDVCEEFYFSLFCQLSCLILASLKSKLTQRPNILITARKRSLGKGNVFTPVCDSFCSGWRGELSLWSASGRYASYWNAFLFAYIVL